MLLKSMKLEADMKGIRRTMSGMEEEDSTINTEVTTMVNRIAACMAVNYTMKVEI